MNKIKKLSDLKVNEIYVLTWGEKIIEKVKLLAIINEYQNGLRVKYTEMYFETKTGTNLVWTHEIGIGNTKEQALSNYGNFKFEENATFYSSYDIAKGDITTNLKSKTFIHHNSKF